ncbi:MAG TPA: NUDIX domain-containing protein [Gallicola sp.]|nr:NUDIX domain-containing protein [Gallicola sp.]
MINEESVMAVVICNNKILTIHEIVYGVLKVSLPKGHLEKGETYMECAIRETFEETNIILNRSQFIKMLNQYHYEFINHDGEEVRKTITPLLFFIDKEGNPMPKEARMVKVEYLEIDAFLEICSYENVKEVIKEVKNI